MNISITTRKYRLIGFTPILGTQPADEYIFTNYVENKAPSEQQARQERSMVNLEEGVGGMTIFSRRPEDEALCLLDYMFLGFFKEALESITVDANVKQPRQKVDRYLFVEPRVIPLQRDGREIFEEDDFFERPVRVMYKGSQMSALKSSELVNSPWTMDIAIKLIDNRGTNRGLGGGSDPLSWEAIEAALDYGKLRGIGQWRNGGFGRFHWKRLEDEA